MSPQIPNLVLSNGKAMPQFGFGTFKISPEDTFDAVSSALELGYRHIDTAQMYGNEVEVGRAIAESGIPREQIFLTSKLNNRNHEPQAARDSFKQSLEDLQSDYVDLFLVHWPLPGLYEGNVALPWPVLEEFYDLGQAQAIGLSNYQASHIDEVLKVASVSPHVLQIEAHPYLPNNALRDYARSLGMVIEAWSPLARGRATCDPILAKIGAAHAKSAAQVALAWALQRGDAVFPKSLDPARQLENREAVGLELSTEECALISSLDEGEAGRTGSHPDTMNRL
ncbi:aldo/keto reductase [Schaalia cardiffensis]